MIRRHRRNPTPGETYLGVIEKWRNVVGPRVARQLAQAARRYEILSRKIDRDYEIGRTRRIEEKEQVAEELRDRLEALQELHDDAGESMASEIEAGAEEQLASAWAQYHDPDHYWYRDRQTVTGHLRAVMEEEVWRAMAAGAGRGEGVGIHPRRFRFSDRRLWAAAKDAYERRVKLRARLRRP
jgi:hypothetical protein